MWKPSTFGFFVDSSLAFQSGRCLRCQFRRTQPKTFARLVSNGNNSSKKSALPLVDHKSAVKPLTQQSAQPPVKQGGSNVEEFTPKPLSRPLGLQYPPRPGENTGVETRSFRQRHHDFVDYEKHIERRRELFEPQLPFLPVSNPK